MYLNRLKIKTVIEILTVGLMLALGTVVFMENNRAKLEETIRNLIVDKFRSTYTVNKKSIGDSFVDASTELEATLDKNIQTKQLIVLGFQLADRSDKLHFINKLKRKLNVKTDFNTFKLFRSETVLGEGTICETKPCNIYLMKRDDSETIYVGIYVN